MLGSLTSTERGDALAVLLAAHPELADEAERIAGELLASPSFAEVASEVEYTLAAVPLDALAARAGRVRGRGYVHETDAAWELVEEAIAPFLADSERRAALGFRDAATDIAIGIVAGLYQVREPEMGSVLAYAGEDAPGELAAVVVDRAEKLGLNITADDAETYWPGWDDLQ